jgi:hypothetical protein
VRPGVIINEKMGHAVLLNLPVPPSANGLYKSVMLKRPNRKPTMRRVKTREYVIYSNQMQHWRLQNHRGVRALNAWILATFPERPGAQPLIWLDRFFHLHRSTLWTQKNTVKKYDVTNRIKALDDELTKIIELDDCLIWGGSEEKNEIPEEVQPCVNIIIKPAHRKLFLGGVEKKGTTMVAKKDS